VQDHVQDGVGTQAVAPGRGIDHHRRVRIVEAGGNLRGVDGDVATTASTNINDVDTTPTSTDAFLMANGFRALAIRINTANVRTAGGLTVADYLETLKLMGTAGPLPVIGPNGGPKRKPRRACAPAGFVEISL
jgi:hypothetical protein